MSLMVRIDGVYTGRIIMSRHGTHKMLGNIIVVSTLTTIIFNIFRFDYNSKTTYFSPFQNQKNPPKCFSYFAVKIEPTSTKFS
jgi:hypothetical protein